MGCPHGHEYLPCVDCADAAGYARAVEDVRHAFEMQDLQRLFTHAEIQETLRALLPPSQGEAGAHWEIRGKDVTLVQPAPSPGDYARLAASQRELTADERKAIGDPSAL